MSAAARVLFGCLFVLSCAACAFHPDPTELNFYVTIRNDTGRTVVLSYCATGDPACRGKLYSTTTVRPGTKWGPTQTAVGISNSLLVQAPSGRRLGCIPLYFDYNADGTVLRASETVPCAESYPVRGRSATTTTT